MSEPFQWRAAPLFHRLRVSLLALLVSALPLHAGDIYPLLQADRSALVKTPEAIATFQATLRSLQESGALARGAGMTPRPELGGVAAKPWLLDHVAPDFACLRDPGGMCREDGTPQARFLDLFADRPAVGDPLATLPSLTIETSRIATEHARLSEVGGMLCTPHATVPGRNRVEAALRIWSGEDDLLILDRLHAIIGTYNYRSAPRISAPVLETLRDAVLYLPDPWTVTEEPRADAPPYRWHEVMLPDGRRAYVAPSPGDLLDAGGLGARVCFDVAGGSARIRAHLGGGD